MLKILKKKFQLIESVMLFKIPPSKPVCVLPEAKVLGTWIHMYTQCEEWNKEKENYNSTTWLLLGMFNT